MNGCIYGKSGCLILNAQATVNVNKIHQITGKKSDTLIMTWITLLLRRICENKVE